MEDSSSVSQTGAGTITLRSLRALAPEATLRIASIEMASPGQVNLTGSGEIIKETGGLLEKAVTLGQTRRRAKLENAGLEQDQLVKTQLDELKLANERLDFVTKFVETRFGPTWRENPVAVELFDRSAQGLFAVEGFAASGRLLERGEEAA
jgi:hypothetical protein